MKRLPQHLTARLRRVITPPKPMCATHPEKLAIVLMEGDTPMCASCAKTALLAA